MDEKFCKGCQQPHPLTEEWWYRTGTYWRCRERKVAAARHSARRVREREAERQRLERDESDRRRRQKEMAEEDLAIKNRKALDREIWLARRRPEPTSVDSLLVVRLPPAPVPTQAEVRMKRGGQSRGNAALRYQAAAAQIGKWCSKCLQTHPRSSVYWYKNRGKFSTCRRARRAEIQRKAHERKDGRTSGGAVGG